MVIFGRDNVVDARGQVAVEGITMARVPSSDGVLVAGNTAMTRDVAVESRRRRLVVMVIVVMMKIVLFLRVVRFLRDRRWMTRRGGLKGVDDAR